jgi:hypothetical protein
VKDRLIHDIARSVAIYLANQVRPQPSKEEQRQGFGTLHNTARASNKANEIQIKRI